jgi:hypothetical protein
MSRAVVLAALLAAAPAWAAEDGVQVNAFRHPVDKSYRKMVNGMDLFEARHALAPHASLRYRLLPRKSDTDLEGIELHVVGRSVDRPVAVAADHTFTLERDGQALREGATVRSERKARTMTWRADIRTPGLPPDVRRLGDLRLECQVGMEAGLVSQYPSVLGRLFALIESPTEFCSGRDAPYLFFAERPVFSVALSSGARRETLSVGRLYAGRAHGRTPDNELRYCDCEALLDRAYTLPLGDRSWPDDTRVEFEYMDAPSSAEPLAGWTKADVETAMRTKAADIRFDSGLQVWAYQFGGEKDAFAHSEFVVLFDRSGVVAKARLR